jgi:hypothetical protein
VAHVDQIHQEQGSACIDIDLMDSPNPVWPVASQDDMLPQCRLSANKAHAFYVIIKGLKIRVFYNYWYVFGMLVNIKSGSDVFIGLMLHLAARVSEAVTGRNLKWQRRPGFSGTIQWVTTGKS